MANYLRSYSIGKKMRRQRKHAVSLKECSGCSFSPKQMKLCVRKLVGQVRNAILMNVYLDLGNPGGRDFG